MSAPEPSSTVVRSEVLVPGPAEGLAGLLGCDPPDPAGPLPPLWHCVYLLDRPALTELGPDGHPRVAAVPLPPGPGMRRMFAGGRVQVLAPLLLGRHASRRTAVASRTTKQGRTGPLTFVTVRHVVSQDGRPCVVEEQDLVYRPAGGPSPGPPSQPRDVASLLPHERVAPVDPVLLFRFSALTYNGHRIHYDREYARDVEGWAGLVVHGPWQARLMAEAARGLPAVTSARTLPCCSPSRWRHPCSTATAWSCPPSSSRDRPAATSTTGPAGAPPPPP